MGTTPGQKFTFALTGPLPQEQAEFMYAVGREAVIYALMVLSAGECFNGRENPAMTPTTPSGMIPVSEKPAAPKRRQKPGAKIGPQGHYRQLPAIRHHQEQPPLPCCPDGGTPFGKPRERRTPLCPGRQTCLPHLRRELKKVDDHNGSGEWGEFSKKLGRILKDSIRLRKKDLPEPKFSLCAHALTSAGTILLRCHGEMSTDW